MNTTTYKTNPTSSYKPAVTPKNDLRSLVSSEVSKLLGTYHFTATFEEDIQTTNTFNGIPGLTAFICTLKHGDVVIGQGRGTGVINQVNRFVIRTIGFAYNASFIDAVVRATKLQDVFRTDDDAHPWAEVLETEDIATPKQIDYLRQLIHLNIDNEDELSRLDSQLSGLTKQEASQMIESFRR